MKWEARSWSILLISLCLLLLCDSQATPSRKMRLLRLPASARHRGLSAPRFHLTNGKASNWAGYVVQTDLARPEKHSATDVQGSWQVPAVASSRRIDTYSAIWVGLDGSSNNTVEQIGTEQDWTSGAPDYYAWFEMYPARGRVIRHFPVAAGDQISAEVQFVGKTKFILSITNLTQNVGFSIVKRRPAKRTSAEWIVEAPYYRGILPLADFGTTTFTSCSATLNGHTGPIDDPSWQNESLTMEKPRSVLAAQPSGLTAGGTSFSVTWHHR